MTWLSDMRPTLQQQEPEGPGHRWQAAEEPGTSAKMRGLLKVAAASSQVSQGKRRLKTIQAMSQGSQPHLIPDIFKGQR